MKRLIRLLGLALLLLLLVLVGRAVLSRSRQPPAPAQPVAPFPIDEGAAAQRLSRAVELRTVSAEQPGGGDEGAHPALRALLQEQFPRVHQALRREVLDQHSLLFRWAGADAALPPLVLMGHMDVVPVDPSTEAQWTHPPFSGAVAGGFVWGRGTLDDKSGVLAQLEAVEGLLQQGFAPRRTVYLAFGHDEEVLGHGAGVMAEVIRKSGPAPALVLDEGMAIVEGILPGLAAPVALVGVAQKGYVTVDLSVQLEGGHSSLPQRDSAIAVLAAALVRLQERPFPAHLSGSAGALFDYVGPEMAFPLRLVMANRWLLGPVLTQVLLQQPSTAALLRTTTALTLVSGGIKDNVLAASARATVNFRILPGDSVAAVLAGVERTIADGRVKVAARGNPREPSPIAPPDSPNFALVQRTLREVAPEVVVAPSLVLGWTDAGHYTDWVPDVYRMRPMTLRSEDLARVHGVNERISVRDYSRFIRFYAQLIRNLQ